MIEKLFRLQESGTTIKREIVAGCTTFMTLSYIIFVQPAVLAAAGMEAGAVMVATCIASAFAMILMAFLANYPIALAPAMGHNFYFAFTVCLTLGVSWQHALGAVFIAGALFILLSSVGLRETVMNVLPVGVYKSWGRDDMASKMRYTFWVLPYNPERSPLTDAMSNK